MVVSARSALEQSVEGAGVRRAPGWSVAFLALAVMLAGCSGGSSSKSGPHGQAVRSVLTPPPGQGPPSPGPRGAKPAIPTGAYLGAWVNPTSANGTSLSKSTQIPSFENAIRRHLGIDHHFYKWREDFPGPEAQADVQKGSIPLLSWACGALDTDVAAGKEDRVIVSRARAIKAFGHPVFVRWFWEMNLQKKHANCIGDAGATGYVAAWQHIWTVFQREGVRNVAWVWCPGGDAFPQPAASFYPGDRYVDWVAADGYNKSANPKSFRRSFTRFYTAWGDRGKPLMIGETGAAQGMPQVEWLTTARDVLKTEWPSIKAVVYWDAIGVRNYGLAGAGLETFRSLAVDPYFRS